MHGVYLHVIEIMKLQFPNKKIYMLYKSVWMFMLQKFVSYSSFSITASKKSGKRIWCAEKVCKDDKGESEGPRVKEKVI